MPTKLLDKDGNEVEAFTEEELKEKQKEAIAEYVKSNPDKSAEFKKLQDDLAEATKKLDEGGMNDGQKERLKKAKEDAEAKLAENVTTLTKEISDLKENFVGGIKNKALDALSKKDPDVRAKIDLKYVSLMKTGDYKNDEAGITQALTEAATLVTGNKPAPNFMDNISGAGIRGDNQNNKGDVQETENSKNMRTVFGIKDADVKKYEGQIK